MARSSDLPRRIDPAADAPRRRIADDHERPHVGHLGPRVAQLDRFDLLVWCRDGARENHDAFAATGVVQDLERPRKAFRPARRAWIVHRDGKIGFGREPQALFDQRPWLEIVGEVDRAEIMAEWRADTRGCRQHRRHAGQHANRQIVPLRRV
ncbi:hypothetical protein chiPu_0033930, partial [Chiloscyllium punctatum]|nr:hypothetical protein [Chiloscyllium punctatum]